jgi:ribosomal protein S18 acetylase RimI-like enzyme
MFVRPFRDCDGDSLRHIEIQCYPNPWMPNEWTQFGRLTMVGITDGKVVGYYCLKGSKLLRFAVSPSWSRMGVGTTLMASVKENCGSKVTIVVPERGEVVQLFLRGQGFKCVNTIKNAFNDLGVVEDGFYFLYKKSWGD